MRAPRGGLGRAVRKASLSGDRQDAMKGGLPGARPAASRGSGGCDQGRPVSSDAVRGSGLGAEFGANFAARIETGDVLVAMGIEQRIEGQPDIGAGILHDLLHAQIDLLALVVAGLFQPLLPEILDLRIGPAL